MYRLVRFLDAMYHRLSLCSHTWMHRGGNPAWICNLWERMNAERGEG